ncbi:MAG: ABC transporter permease [Vicinamibacterales bacterium]
MNRTSALTQTLVVWRKELVDSSRDKRSLYSLLFGALFGPLLLGFILNRVVDRQRESEEIRLPVVGAENAPALVEWLRQQSGIEILPAPADPEKSVRDQDHDVVVIIEEDFAKRFRASRPAPVKVVSDESRQRARPKVQRVRGLLQRYSAEVGSLRLVGRGVNPSIATAIQVEDVEVSSAQQRAAMVLNFIPLFVVLAAFTAGMQIAMDSTAGERERGSLEPLLVNPAPRLAIVSGKWLAASVSAMAGCGVTVLLCLAVMKFVPLQELGIRFRFGAPEVAALLAAVLPFCPAAAALQVYLATFARSFKEAQSYMGFLMMVPMLPGVLATVYPLNGQIWMFPIPIVGQYALMEEVLGGKPTASWMFLFAGASPLIVAALLVVATSRLIEREKIVFGR